MSNARLSRIELFSFHNCPSFLQENEVSGCWFGVLKLTCGEQISYGVSILCAGDNAVDLIKWGAFLKSVRHCTVEEALGQLHLHGQEWAPNQRILLQTALENILQAQQLQLKTVGTGGRTEHRHHASLAGIERAQPYMKGEERGPDPSLLFKESVAYYSLV